MMYIYGLALHRGREFNLVPPTPQTTPADMLLWQQFVEYDMGTPCWLIYVPSKSN